MVSRALDPEEPLSFQHVMDLLGTAVLAFALGRGIRNGVGKRRETASGAGSATVSKRDALLKAAENDKLRNAINEIYREGAII